MEKTVCELFAGVGGFHLGLHRADSEWNVVFANQWEPSRKAQYAYECYKKQFPDSTILNVDIAKVNENINEYSDGNNKFTYNLLVGGFPCQDYSVAATGAKGIEGKKGVLWWEIKKFLERDKPSFVLLENVDRLLKSPAKQRGRDFGIILATFRDLGYNVEWRVINAADYGFPQKRTRVFIFANLNTTKYHRNQMKNTDWNNEESYVNYISSDGFFSEQFPIKETVLTSVYKLEQDILTISDTFKFEFQNSGVMINDFIVTQKYYPVNEEPVTLGEILEKDVSEEYYLGEELADWEFMKGSKAIPRKSKDGHEYMFREGAIAFPDYLDKPARTMLTSEASKNRSTHIIRDPQTKRLRLLTPVECERINGFDDNWTQGTMTERFRYFCMGNALVVGLIERMGLTLSSIFEAEDVIKKTTEMSNEIVEHEEVAVDEQISFYNL